MEKFSKKINRKNTKSYKWDTLEEKFGNSEARPFWVADMDFRVPEAIEKAIKKRAEHPVFGYTIQTDSFYQSIIDFVKRHHNWTIKKEWIYITPGVMAGVGFGIQSLTEVGDEVIVQPPVYNPFYEVILANKRKIFKNPLLLEEVGFKINFKQLEEVLKEGKLLLLSSPHNPTGRVFTKEELHEIATLAKKYNVPIVSDEIHSDVIFDNRKHYPIVSIDSWVEGHSITMIAPSKTFNVPGLSTSVAIIPNPEIRKNFSQAFNAIGGHEGNTFGVEALEAAYTDCDQWLFDLRTYLTGSRDFVVNFLKENLPQAKTYGTEGTFLMWLDLSAYGDNKSIEKALIFKGNIALTNGLTYGEEGNGFFRLNIGCSREELEKGLMSIYKTLKGC
ncbi:hypothetical protein AZF37_00365 [endosymbiont 'TC1' of Trimyema compressum]|uniref:MalY/PatB family protein n=1 Tax=endosymbiont 'TC1' of Trimyema compressum TaxID=243899 RepID=UPI0007F1813C|nr:MalY/PatB family protein [endosymbiont 'TC1' of Trimyema compressum]AMP19834.1 hypothetical protein AZF37_00365 [endosymbiont 'TC1' of Trimyema compressum]